MLHNCNITLYNKIIEPDSTEKYRRTEIYDVFWEDKKGISSHRIGVDTDDLATIIIWFESKCDKTFEKPKIWAKNNYPKHKFTLQPGDIIIKNIVDGADEIADFEKLERNYDDVLKISLVTTGDFGDETSQHWQIGAN